MNAAASATNSALRASAGSATSTRSMQFWKFQGLGNDFILIDNRSSEDPFLTPEESERVCDRHFGIGADGVIFLMPPPHASEADYAMRIYNSDGSEPEMCGNGIRCLAKFAAQCDDSLSSDLRIHTLAGTIAPVLDPDGLVVVDMGEPELQLAEVPADETHLGASKSGNEAARSITVDGAARDMIAVSMGNPHCVTWVDADEYAAFDETLEQVGPRWETHSAFPNKTNTEFVQVLSQSKVNMLVWERGAGRTLACGTGACAVVVASVLAGKTERKCEVVLPGGPLHIEWRESNNHVYMTGPAELVFTGTLEL
eukprot:CAMPEP_0185849610 /NCGR_PEP_ID=MMETSP1354-20130828/4059_1 /TAXON_ID=708628 /ORGANISM="Erythrolobus madagascarensis, Strain CCMP3276" /LENGTH=311 /DNA_ID=CAMNT_0028550171 /DNA_START=667 /DNA_END=1602 /DNA_ORIENTATION=-